MIKNAQTVQLAIFATVVQTESIPQTIICIMGRYVLKVFIVSKDLQLLRHAQSVLTILNMVHPLSHNVYYVQQILLMIKLDKVVADLVVLMQLQLKEVQLAHAQETLEPFQLQILLADVRAVMITLMESLDKVKAQKVETLIVLPQCLIVVTVKLRQEMRKDSAFPLMIVAQLVMAVMVQDQKLLEFVHAKINKMWMLYAIKIAEKKLLSQQYQVVIVLILQFHRMVRV